MVPPLLTTEQMGSDKGVLDNQLGSKDQKTSLKIQIEKRYQIIL